MKKRPMFNAFATVHGKFSAKMVGGMKKRPMFNAFATAP
jgi:hypothetical protein